MSLIDEPISVGVTQQPIVSSTSLSVPLSSIGVVCCHCYQLSVGSSMSLIDEPVGLPCAVREATVTYQRVMPVMRHPSCLSSLCPL